MPDLPGQLFREDGSVYKLDEKGEWSETGRTGQCGGVQDKVTPECQQAMKDVELEVVED